MVVYIIMKDTPRSFCKSIHEVYLSFKEAKEKVEQYNDNAIYNKYFIIRRKVK